MHRSPSGWGQTDFEHLLEGFGFKWKEGKRHRIYSHHKFPDLSISVPRHNALKEWVARDAVKLINELINRTEKKEKTNGTNNENA